MGEGEELRRKARESWQTPPWGGRAVLTCCYNREEKLDEVEEVEEYDKGEGAEEREEEDVPPIQVVHSWGGRGGGRRKWWEGRQSGQSTLLARYLISKGSLNYEVVAATGEGRARGEGQVRAH